MQEKPISIYVHIPFCEKKCAYCAFNSFCASEKQKEECLDFLCKEIASRKVARPVATIYVGGGTPSVLTEEQIERVANAIYDNFDVYEDAEFTIEANPNSITENLLKKWKSLRVNRLSIGVQTLNERSLKQIGRLHDRKTALEKVKLARKFFANVSCDLIIGLEGQTEKDLCRDAKTLLELGVKHISCYLLEVYENTPLARMIANGKFLPLDEEQTISAFNKLATFLQDEGMTRYEISNFAFDGWESRHNLNYWARGEYLGFGLSAHSFLNGKRFQNAETLEKYSNGEVVEENLSAKEEDEERVMLGLRCNLGVDLSTIQTYDITQNAYFDEYLSQGILQRKGDRLFLNPLFWHVSNTIISNLLP